jgi:hypothetical protein
MRFGPLIPLAVGVSTSPMPHFSSPETSTFRKYEKSWISCGDPPHDPGKASATASRSDRHKAGGEIRISSGLSEREREARIGDYGRREAAVARVAGEMGIVLQVLTSDSARPRWPHADLRRQARGEVDSEPSEAHRYRQDHPFRRGTILGFNDLICGSPVAFPRMSIDALIGFKRSGRRSDR